MASDLELILISTASHSAANRPSACCRSWFIGEPPKVHPGEHGRTPSPNPHSTCGQVGRTPMNPRVSDGEYRAGPVFHGRDENHTAPPESIVFSLNQILSQISETATAGLYI
ncbi:unnamed protein product [Knipowitschia caucasica]